MIYASWYLGPKFELYGSQGSQVGFGAGCRSRNYREHITEA